MARAYSLDLRERVVAAVENGGLSQRRAAVQFGVGISTVITWVRRLRETGSVAPGKMGGHKPKAIAGAMDIRGVPHHDRQADAQPRTARHGLPQALGPSTPPCASGRSDRGFCEKLLSAPGRRCDPETARPRRMGA